MKKLEDMDYKELHNFLTGQALMDIGAGKDFRQVVSTIIHCSTWWMEDQNKKKEKKDAKNN